ncbi:MAG: peptidyl-prolyl cis-trans isomerase [Deltaproteobacteria bacterium]|nr:peptidyl-prolyl cis-trans isomerase [Deltaproteobacteria bacterium]
MNLSSKVKRAASEPLLHFLLLGAAVYALYGLVGPGSEPKAAGNRITVTSGEVDWLSASWEKRWNRPPTPEERDGLIREYVRESVFYREALAMGLDRNDTIIRRRLAQKLEFLTQDLVATVPPEAGELQTWFDEHAQRYELPALTSFTHVFVDPDRREDATLADAEGIGAALRALDPPTEGAEEFGDPFMLQSYYPERSEAEIAKLFGGEFASEVAALEPGLWHGPVLSGYGVHWVYVDGRSTAEMPQFAAVSERVVQDWEDARREKFGAEYYQGLLARYEVVIEDDREPVADYAVAPEAER